MALPRPSCLRGAVGRSTLRRAGSQARAKTFRDIGRRTYASGHEAKKSSDLPWAIGSLVVTVPAATWLLGQTPQKSDHGHHEDHSSAKEEESKEEEQPQKEDEESKDEGDGDSKEDSKDESKSDDSSSDDEGQDKDTPQTSDDEQEKGPGEGQKGERKPTEKKGEKDAAKDYSGAQNPRMDEPEKSRKHEGMPETAKIHGTVDPKRGSSKE